MAEVDRDRPSEASSSTLAGHSDLPGEDEMDFYHQLEHSGWKCGVHDPDFDLPLDGTLHLERGLRHMLRLECEDDSLNIESKKASEIQAEPRDLPTGFGLALIDALSSSTHAEGGGVLCTLVASSEEESELFLRVMCRLRDHPRSFRRAERKATLGCMPVSCPVPACVKRARRSKRSASAPPLPEQGLLEGHSKSVPSGRSASTSGRPSQSVAELQPLGLEETRAHVLKLWGEALRLAGSTRSNSFSSLAKKNVRRSSGEKQMLDKDSLEADTCASLLRRLLCEDEVTGGSKRRTDLFASRNQNDTGVSFADFWEVFIQLSLVLPLWREQSLQSYIKEGGKPGMTSEKWGWFLVQIQQEQRALVEAAPKLLKELGTPDVDSNGRLTVIGLSKLLCSAKNSIARLGQSDKVHQEMDHPLTDYWISSAHHLHATSSEARESGFADSTNGTLEPLAASLRSGCRCIGLAVTLGSDEQKQGQELFVQLQQERAPLAEVLQLLPTHGFERSDYPLLLVLWLGMLPLKACEWIPAALEAELGKLLWREDLPGGQCQGVLPAPEAAKGKVVVILSPTTAVDPSLYPLPAPLQQGPAGRQSRQEREREQEQENERDLEGALETWEAASRDFAIWPGQSCARQIPESSGETRVNFLACDEFQMLGEATQELRKHCEETLALVYPMAPRSAPSNYNTAAAWAAGVQLAAISFHRGSGDSAALAHAGRFRENGGCGYVLKPPHLRRGGAGGTETHQTSLSLEFRVVAARALKSLGEPQDSQLGPVVVAMSIWGAPEDCARRACRPVRPVGSVVTWPQGELAGAGGGAAAKPLKFSVASPSTAILVVELFELREREGGGRRIGFFAAGVDSLRQGLRWVPLWSQGQGAEVIQGHLGPLAGVLVHASTKSVRRV